MGGNLTDQKQVLQYKKEEEKFTKLQNELKVSSESYELQTAYFNQDQMVYFQGLTGVKNIFVQTCYETFSSLQDNCKQYIEASSICYRVPFNSESFDELKQNVVKNQFEFTELVEPAQERSLSFACYKFFNELLSKNENALVGEIISLSKYCQDQSRLTYYVRSLYDREIDVYEYLESINKIPGAMSPGIRYLYILVLTYDELKLTKDPNKIGKLLMQSITDNLKTIKESTGDKQFIYYILKIGDIIQYRGEKRVSMMGITHLRFPVIEKYKFKKRAKEIKKGDIDKKEYDKLEEEDNDDITTLSEKSQSQQSKLSDQNKLGTHSMVSTIDSGFMQTFSQGLQKLFDKELSTLKYIQTPEF